MIQNFQAMIEAFVATAADWAWGWPLIILLIGGGTYLTIRSGFVPFLRVRHAIAIICGKFDDPNDPGQISHFQALMTALASTIGVGNIAGVAVAISLGGPGAVFWMWVAAIVGMGSKFFECTLACMYRKTDADGVAQGGPMYYIELGLGRRFRYLGIMFCVFGLVGCLSLFQANQLGEVLQSRFGVDRWVTGFAAASFVAIVAWGGITWIGRVTSQIVPIMCIVYVMGCLYVIGVNWQAVPGAFYLIVHEAFTGTALGGGALGIATVITVGVRRAAFSNEAGVGTAPLAHGAAKTNEPVREGLVAMVGPFIDTVVICTLTALVILTAGTWEMGEKDDLEGAAVTMRAFNSAMYGYGDLLVVLAVVLFAVSTMLGYSYYGRKCFAYLAGERRGRYYEFFYVAGIVVGAVWSADLVVNVLDTAFALMAFPNLIAVLILSPKVVRAMRIYFAKNDKGSMHKG